MKGKDNENTGIPFCAFPLTLIRQIWQIIVKISTKLKVYTNR